MQDVIECDIDKINSLDEPASEILKDIELKENRFGFEPEVTAKIAKRKDINIYEVGIKYHGRTYSEGKKIGWKDGLSALRCIIKYNFFY